MGFRGGVAAAALVALLSASPAQSAPSPAVTVSYSSPSALRGLQVLRRIEPLGIAQVRTDDVASLRRRPGVRWVRPSVPRFHLGAPVRTVSSGSAALLQWQLGATRAALVPDWVERAAVSVTIAVVDTGADVTVPDLAAKAPVVHNVASGGEDVADARGHGTLVASLAAGSVTNGEGIDGAGGDAGLMIVQANRDGGNTFTDVDEAAAIVWAVDHGAKIVNLSIGGAQTSAVERGAIEYAAARGVLLVAAAGNTGEVGNQPFYPAALLGSNGLAVGASTASGARASFSTSAPYVSLVAPGVRVLGALSATAPAATFPRASIPGTATGSYGYGTGTSYSAPQVAGAAALVWAANPTLTAADVVQILLRTAAGTGRRTPELGYGVLDVAAAVARASGLQTPAPIRTRLAATPRTLRLPLQKVAVRRRVERARPISAEPLTPPLAWAKRPL
jgi:subtilisin family serine protease